MKAEGQPIKDSYDETAGRRRFIIHVCEQEIMVLKDDIAGTGLFPHVQGAARRIFE